MTQQVSWYLSVKEKTSIYDGKPPTTILLESMWDFLCNQVSYAFYNSIVYNSNFFPLSFLSNIIRYVINIFYGIFMLCPNIFFVYNL